MSSVEIQYQKELNQNYMILPSEKSVENYEQKMILENTIPGMLPVCVRKINGQAFYYYDIHSRQSIRTIFEQKLFDKQVLMYLLCGITKAFQELHLYLLSPENLLLHPECVFLNMETGEVSFCFYPEEKYGRETFEELAEFLIDRVNYEEEEAKTIAYDYYDRVCRQEYDPGEMIEEILKCESEQILPAEWEKNDEKKEEFYFVEPEEKEKEEKIKPSVIQAALCFGVIIAAVSCYLVLLFHPDWMLLIGLSQENYLIIGAVTAVASTVGMTGVLWYFRKREEEQEKPPEQKEIWEGTGECRQTAMEEAFSEGEAYFGETVVLCVDKVWKTPVLKGIDGDEERCFVLDESPYIIGKLSGKANGILTDSRVSRVHAAIREDSGQYYISDLNSTNGTFINDQQLNGTETVLLHHMDKVRMASVEMVFLCQ